MNKADIVRQLFNGMKLRTNVLIVAGLVTWLITDFGDKMINLLGGTVGLSPEAIIGILGVLIGTGIGGLIVAMMEMLTEIASGASGHARADRRCVDGPYRLTWRFATAWRPLRMLRGGLFVV